MFPCPPATVEETLTMLGLPLPGETTEEQSSPSEEERAALREKLPKRWQDRRTPVA
jgi:hypothetical protein